MSVAPWYGVLYKQASGRKKGGSVHLSKGYVMVLTCHHYRRRENDKRRADLNFTSCMMGERLLALCAGREGKLGSAKVRKCALFPCRPFQWGWGLANEHG